MDDETSQTKTVYVCGPLTELPPLDQARVKKLYERIGDLCRETLGHRAFVPHEHYDPIKHANFTPQQVDAGERKQVCELTSHLVVVAEMASWGGGIEVEMANRHGVPAIVLVPLGKRTSRLLLGNPTVMIVYYYKDEEDALSWLGDALLYTSVMQRAKESLAEHFAAIAPPTPEAIAEDIRKRLNGEPQNPATAAPHTPDGF